MTLAQRYEWSGTPMKAGLSPAAAHLQATASAADLSENEIIDDVTIRMIDSCML